MTLAIQNAIIGLQSSSQNFDRAASDIVSGGARAAGDDNDIAAGLASLKGAEAQFKASAKIVGAIARTEGRLLDILA